MGNRTTMPITLNKSMTNGVSNNTRDSIARASFCGTESSQQRLTSGTEKKPNNDVDANEEAVRGGFGLSMCASSRREHREASETST